MVLEKTLESPLDYKEIKPVNLKRNQPWIFTERTDAEAEAPTLWLPDTRSWLIGKDTDAGKDWRQDEKGMTEDDVVGWHQQTWTWANSGRWWWTRKPGMLESMGSQRVGHELTTEQQQWDGKAWNNYFLKGMSAPQTDLDHLGNSYTLSIPGPFLPGHKGAGEWERWGWVEARKHHCYLLASALRTPFLAPWNSASAPVRHVCVWTLSPDKVQIPSHGYSGPQNYQWYWVTPDPQEGLEHMGKISIGRQPVLTLAGFSCSERCGHKRPWVHVSCRQENRAGLFCFWKFSFLLIAGSLPANTNRCFQGMSEPSLVQSVDPCKRRQEVRSHHGQLLWLRLTACILYPEVPKSLAISLLVCRPVHHF